jgi:bifunctional DNA-binding transcriptional regulator/antitoxin component of YhaV-PrlF toxin-antitoxin module
MTIYFEVGKLDNKSRVIIPHRMLSQLGLQEGSDVRVIFVDDHIEIQPFETDYIECSEKMVTTLQDIQNLIGDLKNDILKLSYNK